MSWLRRFANFLRPGRLDRNIDREVRFHVEELVDELVAGGLTVDQARREAHRRFGHAQVVKERVRDVDIPGWLESLAGDIRYAARSLRGSPGFALVVVVSLALGIGANTAIYSLINAVLLRQLPVRDPGSLVRIVMADSGSSFTNPIWEAVHEQQQSLAGTFAFSDRVFDLTNGGVQRQAPGVLVSGDYFSVLGVPPGLGRVLLPSDDVRGCAGVAVLSDRFWQSEYGGDPSAIGRTVSLDGHPFEIVGVATSGFTGLMVGRAPAIYAPLCTLEMLRPGRDILDARSSWYLNIMGRLRSGQSLANARAALGTIAPAVYAATIPQHWTPAEQDEFVQMGLSALPAATGVSLVRGRYRDALFVLLAVVAVVLLVACANVAQLLLARGASREHEAAIRLAVGASRPRLVRQLLTESLLLSLAGAAAGLVFARWSSELVVGYLSQGGRAVDLDLALDPRVLGFTIAVAMATAILFGLVPAWRSARVDPQEAMHGAGRGLVGDSRHRIQKGMVVAQLALSLVLVVAAGLLGGSFRRLTTLDPGFRRDGLLLADVNWSRLGYPEDRQLALRVDLLDRLRAIPGIRYAAASLVTPVGGSFWNEYVEVDGFTPKTERDALLWFNGVTDQYLDAQGTRLIAGRDIEPGDRNGAERVVLVNEEAVRHFFGGQSPLGRYVRTTDHGELGPPMRVIGVVGDAKYGSLTEDATPTAYVPLAQTENWGPSNIMSLRTDGRPDALIPAVTRVVAEVNAGISLEFTTMDAQVATSLARPRLLATLSSFFGGLALLLAVIGLYGAISYGVARRRTEIGVRIALGAQRNGVLRMVAGEAGVVVLLGVAAGAVLTWMSSRLVEAFLFGVTPTDTATLAGAAFTLAAVAMLAGAVPAWRAAAVDPMVALRKE